MAALAAYIGELPTGAAIKLVTGIERDRLLHGAQSEMPHEFILSLVRPRLREIAGPRIGVPSPLRLLCLPFEDLLADAAATKRPGRIARASILPLWDWLHTELLPDTLPDLCARLVGHILSGDPDAKNAAVQVLHDAVAVALRDALLTLDADEKEYSRAVKSVGGEHVIEDARDISEILEIASEFVKLGEFLPRPIEEFTAGFTTKSAQAYHMLEEQFTGKAPYVALIVMSRLTKKWQILKLVTAVANTSNERWLRNSEIGIVCENLLMSIEQQAAFFSRLVPTDYDPVEVLEKLVEFAGDYNGMTKDFDIFKSGSWGGRTQAALSVVSDTMIRRIERMPRDVSAALPLKRIGVYGRHGPRRPDISHPLNEDKVAHATKVVTLLASAGKLADPLAFKSAVKPARDEVDQYLESYGEGIVEEIRQAQEESARDCARSYLDVAENLTRILMGDALANVLQKRGALAAAS